jgi:hypothetical protein
MGKGLQSRHGRAMIWTSGAEGRPHSRDQIMTTATAAATGFQVGQTYYVGQTYHGSLACTHSSFPVTCVKRTEKTVWFKHATLTDDYTPARSRARAWQDGAESANFHGWYVCSTSVKETPGM